jgi:hypothetical protein
MEEQKVEESQDTKETSTSQQPDLNISDLVALKNIIEVATTRGAFKAAELEAVGKTFNKLSGFLDSIAKKD